VKIIVAETGCIEFGGHPYWLKADRYQEISAALTLFAANRDATHTCFSNALYEVRR
jgi:hypothetical protein